MDKSKLTLKIKILPNATGNLKYGSQDAAGLDLSAGITGKINLKPNTFKLIPTGIIAEIPRGFEGQIRPRSGLALKYGLTILNSPGTIDSDYRGEIGVILQNLGLLNFIIEPGMRIAQMILSPITQANIEITDLLSSTKRNKSGFGSSGIK